MTESYKYEMTESFNVGLQDLTLASCMAAYYNRDIDYILDYISTKFTNSFNIPLIPSRFFTNFIDGQANCYTNKFERIISGQDVSLIDFDELNYSLEDCERFMHILKQSILYIKSPTEFQSIDGSNYVEIAPNDYLITTTDGKMRINSTGVYSRVIDVDGQEVDILLHSTNGVCPIVKFSERGITKPQVNILVALEYNTIADMSFGVYNAAPKLLTQAVAKSDQPDDVVREGTRNFGRTTMMLKVGSGEDITTIDMGDLKNLMDIQTIYDNIVKQAAVRLGIDSYSVSISQKDITSGFSKLVELGYVNQYRKKYFRVYNNCEKQIFEILKQMFKLDITFNKIEFYPIEYGFLSTPISSGKTVDSSKTEVEKDIDSTSEVDVESSKIEIEKDVDVESDSKSIES